MNSVVEAHGYNPKTSQRRQAGLCVFMARWLGMVHKETLCREKIKSNKILRSCFRASAAEDLFICYMWVLGKGFVKDKVCALKRLQDLRMNSNGCQQKRTWVCLHVTGGGV